MSVSVFIGTGTFIFELVYCIIAIDYDRKVPAVSVIAAGVNLKHQQLSYMLQELI